MNINDDDGLIIGLPVTKSAFLFILLKQTCFI